jgi:myosin regulatory light chain 12
MMDGLLSDRPGAAHSGGGDDRGINFTMFLTMMGEHLFEFDPEQDLLEAFECFDEADSGFVKCDEIRRWMGDVGERMDAREVRPVARARFRH